MASLARIVDPGAKAVCVRYRAMSMIASNRGNSSKR